MKRYEKRNVKPVPTKPSSSQTARFTLGFNASRVYTNSGRRRRGSAAGFSSRSCLAQICPQPTKAPVCASSHESGTS